MDTDTYTIVINCPDEKGLVHRITGALLTLGLNIEEQDEFVDAAAQHFFLRTAVVGASSIAHIEQETTRVLPDTAHLRVSQSEKKNIVIFASQEPHCLGDLLLRHDYGELKAHILAVISNHRSLEKLVGRFDIPFHYIPAAGRSRIEHEQDVQAVLGNYSFDYLVLAKYMRILSQEFVSGFKEKIINIHHSFLPAFIGAKPYHRAFERGVKIIGATAHFVTADLDEGPIISQDTAAVTHRYSVKDMIRTGRNIEKIVLADALRLVFDERVLVKDNKTIVFN